MGSFHERFSVQEWALAGTVNVTQFMLPNRRKVKLSACSFGGSGGSGSTSFGGGGGGAGASFQGVIDIVPQSIITFEMRFNNYCCVSYLSMPYRRNSNAGGARSALDRNLNQDDITTIYLPVGKNGSGANAAVNSGAGGTSGWFYAGGAALAAGGTYGMSNLGVGLVDPQTGRIFDCSGSSGKVVLNEGFDSVARSIDNYDSVAIKMYPVKYPHNPYQALVNFTSPLTVAQSLGGMGGSSFFGKPLGNGGRGGHAGVGTAAFGEAGGDAFFMVEWDD